MLHAIPHALVALYFQHYVTIVMELQIECWVLILIINKLAFAKQDLSKMLIDNVFSQLVLRLHHSVLNVILFNQILFVLDA